MSEQETFAPQNGGKIAGIKAFNKVNHHALYLKLMKRLIPNELLNLLVFWLSRCCSCLKWIDAWSQFFDFDFGVRQGSVLSPFLFAFLDDLTKSFSLCRGMFIVLYTDDIFTSITFSLHAREISANL